MSSSQSSTKQIWGSSTLNPDQEGVLIARYLQQHCAMRNVLAKLTPTYLSSENSQLMCSRERRGAWGVGCVYMGVYRELHVPVDQGTE